MLFLLILFPMAMGFICFLLGRRSPAARSACGVAVTGIELVLSAFLAMGPGRTEALPGICSLGLCLELDGFRKVYIVIIALMWFMTMLLSDEYFAHYHNRGRYYFFNLLTLGATMGVFLAADLFTAFVFFEVMSFTSYTWVIQEETPGAIRAANTYLAVAVIGGLVALMGLFLLQNRLGTTQISELYAHAQTCPDKKALWIAGSCILFGFGAKAGMFPLHIWLPKAHPVAPAPASALLSGVLTKSGVWGILAISCNIFRHDAAWGTLILSLGTVTMVLGAVLATFSIDLKRTLACSSMSQIGFVLVGVGMMGILGEENALAARGALLHMMNHSLFKLVLFECAGVVYMNLHKLDLNEIRGFGRKKPLLKLAFLLGAMGIGGVPLLNGYVSKTLLHEAIVEGGAYRLVEWLFLGSGGLTVAYMTKLYVCIFVEKHPQKQAEFDENRKYMNIRSAIALCVPALILPALGLTASRSMDAIASLGTDFFHAGPLEHAVRYLSLENLKGAAISLAIGALVYFFIVRRLLMRDGRYVNLWPAKLDLEDLVYRPLLLSWLPGLVGAVCAVFGENKVSRRLYRWGLEGTGRLCALFGENRISGPVFRWILNVPLGQGSRLFGENRVTGPAYRLGVEALGKASDLTGNNRVTGPVALFFMRAGSILMHAFLDLPDAAVYVLHRSFYRESRIPTGEKALESLPYRAGDRIDRWKVKHGTEDAGEHRYARLSYRAWRTLRATTRSITGNLSFALLMLCLALSVVLIYVLGYHR